MHTASLSPVFRSPSLSPFRSTGSSPSLCLPVPQTLPLPLYQANLGHRCASASARTSSIRRVRSFQSQSLPFHRETRKVSCVRRRIFPSISRIAKDSRTLRIKIADLRSSRLKFLPAIVIVNFQLRYPFLVIPSQILLLAEHE